MKTKLKFPALALLALLTLNLQLSTARAQVTAFTYQGRLNSNGSPANGSYDFQFRLYDAGTNGAQVPVVPVASGVLVSNGLFTTGMDFGDVFHGAPQWLEIAVQPHNGAGFVTLSPRQLILPTPYATFANSASNLSGTLPVAQLTGTVPNAQLGSSVSLLGQSIDSSEITDGTIATNDLSANVLNGTFWKLGGNTGANPANGVFLGTADNQPMEFKVNGQRGLRVEYGSNSFSGVSVNLIGGYSGNSVSNGVVGATIGGGGDAGLINQVAGDFGTVGGGEGNTATYYYTTIGGGFNNTASYLDATVGGGYHNTASGVDATVGGGRYNAARGVGATVGGGTFNTASGFVATAGGGTFNTASGDLATVLGGDYNSATNNAFAAGHRAKANHQGAFVWADSTDADFASTSSNQFLIRASGGVGIGTTAPDRPLSILGNGVNGEWVSFKSTNGVTKWHLNNKDGGLNFAQTGVADGRLFLSTNGSVYVNSIAVTSDRNAKENFAAVNSQAVLAKVAALPITEWNYKTADAGQKHLGPMAQDFHAAFGLNGGDDKHISVIDEGGVALAAIQGLNQKLNEKNAEIQELKQRLDTLEIIIRKQASN